MSVNVLIQRLGVGGRKNRCKSELKSHNVDGVALIEIEVTILESCVDLFTGAKLK